MLPIVDANVLLRFLLRDIDEQYAIAKRAIDMGCETTVAVFAEVVYVLAGVYGVPRAEIAQSLIALLDLIYIEKEDEVRRALELYGSRSFDFVDCVLLSMNEISGRKVITFDKKLDKALDETSHS